MRDYGAEGQIGLEPTPEEYVTRMVEVFREVRRVLAAHGTVWLNLGDSYAGSGKGPSNEGSKQRTNHGSLIPGNRNSMQFESGQAPTEWLSVPQGLKGKDLVGIPWRVAFALQADGWYLRSDIIWAKPNPMPESVTDRPTKAHEYVFLLSKQPRYFFDQEAVREGYKCDGRKVTTVQGGDGSIQHRNGERWPGIGKRSHAARASLISHGHDENEPMEINHAGRNIRSVWEIATQPYPEAHFATFPEELARRCIAAGCPESVCRVCGKARERVVGEVAVTPDLSQRSTEHYNTADRYGADNGGNDGLDRLASKMRAGIGRGHLGWSDCGHADYRPGITLDPFIGSGTVAHVARKLGRHALGIDLSEEYLKLAARRLQQQSLFAGVADGL